MSSEEKHIKQKPESIILHPIVKKIFYDIDHLPEAQKEQFFKYFYKKAPTEYSSYAHLKEEICKAVDAYKGGFFGISQRREKNMAEIKKMCDEYVIQEGRTYHLALQIYKYAKEQIVTGFLGRSDLRDKVLKALDTADPLLVQSLAKGVAKEYLMLPELSEMQEDHPSVMQLPYLLQDLSRASDEVPAAFSFSNRAEQEERVVLEKYRDTLE